MPADSSAAGAVRDRYLSDFRTFMASVARDTPQWLADVRQNGIDKFAATGFPTKRDEKWRFTNFSKLADREFAIRNGGEVTKPGTIGDAEVPVWKAATRVVFVDGLHAPELSSAGILPDGVVVGDLASAIAAKDLTVRENLDKVSESDDNPFGALNTAFMRDGAILIVPDSTVIEEPIQFLFLTTTEGTNVVSHPRNVVVVGENAEATVVEMYVGQEDAHSWTNTLTEVALGDAGRLKAQRIQLEGENAFHTATTRCTQGRDSSYSLTTAEFGGRLSRHDIQIGLNGTGASTALNGVLHLAGKQHVDNQTTIEHAKPHCTSREIFNGIFDDESHGVFTGRVLVQPGAQQTDAHQSSRNLLLSEKARADAQPQLEIFADDVKCAHGTTVGPIDEDALFYLRSKGLAAGAARSMLTYGFAAEIVNSIGVEGLRDWTDTLLRNRLENPSRQGQKRGGN